MRKLPRRLALGAGLAACLPVLARAQPAAEFAEAARQEGQLNLHSSDEPGLLGQLVRAFQTAFPGIVVNVSRADSPQQLQAIQEATGEAAAAIDVLTSTNLAAMVELRRAGRLALFRPEEVRRWPNTARDPDGFYSFSSLTLMVLGYNNRQWLPQVAPRGYGDLLSARFAGHVVVPHPAYSGEALSATFLLANALGWVFFEQFSRQEVLNVQSPAEAVAKVSAGERSAMLYGSEQAAFRAKLSDAPLGIVYPDDGTPAVPAATAVMREAAHPNAARLFASWIVGREAQEMIVAAGGRSFHPDVREPTGRTALNAIKLLSPDPILLAAESDLVRQFYGQLFLK